MSVEDLKHTQDEVPSEEIPHAVHTGFCGRLVLDEEGRMFLCNKEGACLKEEFKRKDKEIMYPTQVCKEGH